MGAARKPAVTVCNFLRGENMKLYAYHLMEGGTFIYWYADKDKAKYQGDTYAELKFGMQKGEAQGYVREVDVPTANAEALAQWMNKECAL
jgi:hypothetical protein